MEASGKNKILVAPLNWGLGHATRCIPIIRKLQEHNFTPILASDGQSLELLKKEFPQLEFRELPSYQISYPENGADFKWKMLRNTPKMVDAVLQERKVVKRLVKELDLCGIISDNRLGVVSKKVPSVFMTHQLNVLSGNTSWLTSAVHRQIIRKFTECWVPDNSGPFNLSGKLGHSDDEIAGVRYIGPLSRFEKKDLPKKFDLMILLSGPEPQRSILEKKLHEQILEFKGKVLFVKGIVDGEMTSKQVRHVTFCNYLTSEALENAMNESDLLLCRSGYTTIMDLSKLGKKAFLIPTPGQFEQEYLAKKMKKEGYAPYAKQEKFRLSTLNSVDLYRGIPEFASDVHWKNLFCLFERE